MKPKYKRHVCRFELRLPNYGGCHFIKRALKLETTLARKPRILRIEMIGDGEIPADTAMLIRSILVKRSRGTRLVTNTRSSLQGGSVLVWLLGDERTIRDDARVFFKRNPLADEDPVEVYAGLGEAAPKYKDSYAYVDPEDADYARMLEYINEFLPVNEFAGKVINVPTLREFGLIKNEQMENLLASTLSKKERAPPAANPDEIKKDERRGRRRKLPPALLIFPLKNLSQPCGGSRGRVRRPDLRRRQRR